VTGINTLTYSKPHFLAPPTAANVSKPISKSTIRFAGGRIGHFTLTVSWTKVQEHGKEVASKVDLKICRMKNKIVFNQVSSIGGYVCEETSRLSFQALLSYR